MLTQGDRPNYRSSGYSEELNVQNVSYFMLFSSCSETFQIRRNIMLKERSHIGYSLFRGVCSDSCFAEVLASGVSSIISMYATSSLEKS